MNSGTPKAVCTGASASDAEHPTCHMNDITIIVLPL